MKCINPATEEVIDRVACDDRRSVHNAYRRLKSGQREWMRWDMDKRRRLLERFKDVLGRRQSKLVELLVDEVGTPIRRAQKEVAFARRRIDDFISFGQKAVADEVVEEGGGMREVVRRSPLGVVAHISTWDRPCATAVEVLVPALLAGNTVLYKPSEHAVLVGKCLVEAMRHAGLDEHVVDISVGDGSVGDFILDESVSYVAFAGSASTGQMVAEKLARRMIPHRLDIGQTEGLYVCEDVDVEYAAVRIADRAFGHGGQGCGAIDRIYVHEAVARPFTQAVCRRVDSFDVGEPVREDTVVGPQVCNRRLGRIEYQIGDAVQKGARLLLGGRARGGRGYFFEPTVMVDVDHRMLVMREETKGPVICIQRVGDDQEAEHRLSDVDYGLCAGMMCEDKQRAVRIFDRLDADSVYWWKGDGGGDSNPVSSTPTVKRMIGSARESITQFTRPQSWRLSTTARG